MNITKICRKSIPNCHDCVHFQYGLPTYSKKQLDYSYGKCNRIYTRTSPKLVYASFAPRPPIRDPKGVSTLVDAQQNSDSLSRIPFGSEPPSGGSTLDGFAVLRNPSTNEHLRSTVINSTETYFSPPAIIARRYSDLCGSEGKFFINKIHYSNHYYSFSTSSSS
jgi:hypothetical protein